MTAMNASLSCFSRYYVGWLLLMMAEEMMMMMMMMMMMKLSQSL